MAKLDWFYFFLYGNGLEGSAPAVPAAPTAQNSLLSKINHGYIPKDPAQTCLRILFKILDHDMHVGKKVPFFVLRNKPNFCVESDKGV